MTQNRTTAWVTVETAETLRIMSERTGISQTDLLDQIFKNVRKQMSLFKKSGRLLFLSDCYTNDNMPKTIIRLSDNFLGLVCENDLPPSAREFYSKKTAEENKQIRGEK
jgi:hypothetical protein